MRIQLAALMLLLCLSAPARADSTASGDTQVVGQVGVGTLIPQARMQVQMSPSDNYALMVSSQNGAPLLDVTKAGKLGLGVIPQADVDVTGSGNSGDLGLQLRAGNSSMTWLSSQIVFTSSAGFYAHAIRTQATSSQNANNSIDFFLWNNSGSPSASPTLDALSLQAGESGSTAAVHVNPVAAPADAELTISNGQMLGGGTIMRAAAQQHSSRAFKTDISYFGPERAEQAYEEVKGLKHATFRYKKMVRGKTPGKPLLVDNSASPLRRGLIYEDSPESLRGPNKTIVFDYRVMNLELALQEADIRILNIEAKIAALEKQKKAGAKP